MFSKLVVPAALLAGAALPAAALDSFEVFQHARPSMVQIVAVTPTGRMHLGSGVALPNGTVVTNCHVTMQSQRVQQFLGGGGAAAELQAATVAHDICGLYFPDMKREPATLGSSRGLHVGDMVYAVGFNAGNGLSYQPGEVAELFEHDGAMVIRTTAAFTHGASGGGLFDQNGQLVGILTFYRRSKDRTDYFAVPVEWIGGLDKVKAEQVAPLTGTPFWADNVARQPAFLRAGALEADGRWEDLATVARQWTDASPDDGQAWAALGKAAFNLGDARTAHTAFRRAADLGVATPASMQSSDAP